MLAQPAIEALSNSEADRYRLTPTEKSHVVRFILGVVLLLSAGFKAHSLWTDPVPVFGLFTSPRWQVALIELEVLLGLWLVSGLYRRGAWLSAVGAFGALAAVSLYLALSGQPSCGCFGKLEVSPWLSLGLDIIAVGALVRWQTQPTGMLTGVPSLKPVLVSIAGVALLFVASFSGLYLIDPSPEAALAYLRGESMTVEPSVVDVGDGTRGEVRLFPVRVRNHTSRSICVIGGRVGCRCITTDELPVTVPPKAVCSFRCEFEFRGAAGKFQHSFVLLTDDENQPEVISRIGGRVVETVPP